MRKSLNLSGVMVNMYGSMMGELQDAGLSISGGVNGKDEMRRNDDDL